MRRAGPVLALAFGVVLAGATLAQERGADARAMQADDAANPAFLWVKRGEALWSERPASAGAKSCAECHGAASNMAGVGARHPAYDPARRRVIALDQRIDRCRVERQGQGSLGPDDDDLLGLVAYVGLQSRGLPLMASADGAARATYEQGRALYETRLGQLNLSCAQCHDRLQGEHLGGSIIPPARVNGYPVYRIDWQGMGSFARRLRGCLIGVRAEPFASNAPERVALEFFLAVRGAGMPVETPGVRP